MNIYKIDPIALKKNLYKLQSKVKQYVQECSFQEALLLAVSKSYPPEAIKIIFDIGINNFAENFVQEAIPKIKLLPENIIWHYIGSIQSNKIKKLSKYFHWIHSLANVSHAKKLDNHCKILDKKMQVLIQINIDIDLQKSGILVNDNFMKLYQLIEIIINDCSHLQLVGLSCMLANTKKFQSQYCSFMKLYNLKKHINKKFNLKLMHLSMGTSSDMKAAILSGSTMLRIGTAIFSNH